jgi:hypothetical protein
MIVIESGAYLLPIEQAAPDCVRSVNSWRTAVDEG